MNDEGKTFDGSLTLVDSVSSGGEFPVSLTVHDHLLYVVNARGNGRGHRSDFPVFRVAADSAPITLADV